MKVSELEGAKLDYWVARAIGGEAAYFWQDESWRAALDGVPVRYSSDWATAGPIIHRERIGVVDDSPIGAPGTEWIAAVDLIPNADGYGGASFCGTIHPMQRGATPLIASMRAFVASKFGGEVPDA